MAYSRWKKLKLLKPFISARLHQLSVLLWIPPILFHCVLFFEDLAAHDVYQVHEIHKAFLDEFRVLFEKVIIYDAH